MPDDCKRDDLRVVRTKRALLDALLTLLEHHNFGRLTVNDLCGEAQISRATFYTHFIDKYDLLNYWLSIVRSDLTSEGYAYAKLERNINSFVKDKSKVISNLLNDANNEILNILYEFIISFFILPDEKKRERDTAYKDAVFLNFFAGGMINLLMWQKKNNFPDELEMINIYSYDIIKYFLSCNLE